MLQDSVVQCHINILTKCCSLLQLYKSRIATVIAVEFLQIHSNTEKNRIWLSIIM